MIVIIAYCEVRGIVADRRSSSASPRWAGAARAKRAQIITLRNRDFVTAAKFSGERSAADRVQGDHAEHDLAGGQRLHRRRHRRDRGRGRPVVPRLRRSDSVSLGQMLFQANANGALVQGFWVWLLVPGLALALLITVPDVHQLRRRPAEQSAPPGGLSMTSSTSVRAVPHGADALLEVKNLTVRYEPQADTPPLDGRRRRQLLDLRGRVRRPDRESGSGKSTLGTALLRLLERPGRISGGRDRLRRHRHHCTLDRGRAAGDAAGATSSTVFQSSMNALNPVMRIQGQFRDVIEDHTALRGDAVPGADPRAVRDGA